MDSDESHFNVSLIVRDKVTRQCPQTTTFEVKGEPKQIRTEDSQDCDGILSGAALYHVGSSTDMGAYVTKVSCADDNSRHSLM